MNPRPVRVLKMISPVPSPAARAADGWEFRFVAQGSRADEMIELYRNLGFEVAADPVVDELVGQPSPVCDACRTEAVGRMSAIYTRPHVPSPLNEPHRDSE